MMTAGRRTRARKVAIGFAVFVIVMHVIAYSVVGRYADAAIDPQLLIGISATLLLSWLLMISQAMESMTRAFYARADLDLILASPVAAERLFAVRIGTVALSVAAMALPLAGRLHQHADLARRCALAWRLRRHSRHGRHGSRVCRTCDRRFVSPDRPEAYALHRAGHRCSHRRRLRHRPAGGGNSLLRDIVAGERPAVRRRCLRSCPAADSVCVVAGARRAWRCARAHRPARARLRCARRRHRDRCAAFRRLCHRRGERATARRRHARSVRAPCAPLHRGARSAARNGFCCAAILGSSRRR